MDGYTVVRSAKLINFSDKRTIEQIIETFCNEIRHANNEYALVITPNGIAYKLSGTTGTVNPGIIDSDSLKGSIIVHNHPISPGELMGDSFSRADIVFAIKHKTKMQYLVSGERRNAFTYNGSISEEEMW